MKRQQVIDTLSDLPEDFDLEALIEKLIFIEKVHEGLDALEKGETVSHEDVKRQAREWQK